MKQPTFSPSFWAELSSLGGQRTVRPLMGTIVIGHKGLCVRLSFSKRTGRAVTITKGEGRWTKNPECMPKKIVVRDHGILYFCMNKFL